MNNHCSVCGRRLKNPVSVELGIGPVCRAKYSLSEDSKQGVFDFMRAEFEVLEHERGKYIYIRDIGTVCRSVTNDAENVIKRLYEEYEITDETRVFYVDSDNSTDELLHAGRKFTGFKLGHEGVDLEEAL